MGAEQLASEQAFEQAASEQAASQQAHVEPAPAEQAPGAQLMLRQAMALAKLGSQETALKTASAAAATAQANGEERMWAEAQLLVGQIHATVAQQLASEEGELQAVQESAAAFRAVVRLLPTVLPAQVGLGNAAISPVVTEAKDTALAQEGVAAWTAAVNLVPSSLDYQQALGRAHGNVADDAAAVEVYRKVATLAPTNTAVGNELGVALHRAGKYGEAAEAFSAAITLNPGEIGDVMQVNFGHALMLGHDTAGDRDEEAEAAFRHAILISSGTSTDAYRLLATLQHDQHRHQPSTLASKLAQAPMPSQRTISLVRHLTP